MKDHICDRAQLRFLFLEPKVGVDVNDTEAFAVVWESGKNRGSISDNVLDETVSKSAILALSRRHIDSYCKGGGHVELQSEETVSPLI